MTGIQSINPRACRIRSRCYWRAILNYPNECQIVKTGTLISLVLDSTIFLLYMVPQAVCITHNNQEINFIFWTTEKNKCYFDAENDEIVNKLIIWTPKTPKSTTQRSFWYRKTHITQRCLMKVLQLALSGMYLI